MVRNFGVKLIYRIDKILSSVTEVWDDARSVKIAAEGITGLGEYLSCYALTLLGCDVMILAARRDIDAPEELLALSDVIRYSDYRDIDLPPFGSRTVSAPKVTAPPPVQPVEAPHLKIPPRAGRSTPTQSASPPVQSAPPPIQPTEAPHLKIPEHPGRRTPPPPAPRPAAPAPRQQTSAKTSSPRTSSPQPTSPRTPIDTPRTSARQEKTYEQLAAMASSVVMILVADRHGDVEGSGSGIMISKSGLILTNHHVVRGGCRYAVRIENDDRIYETNEVIKYHPDLDLAIIRIDRPLTPVPICPAGEKLVRGQKVIAIGSPLGLFNSVSDGIISGFRDINGRDMIQFTAPISPGSSGGALLNMYGELIGISTAGIESGQNINLAVGFLDILRFAGSLLR
ncbi:MAG: trypsin-like peptidase domain-containing protein [Oscillospiraceae bacterium]|nr:trypsin-like peptidase domain-containing protein [Oscillospiraceae bacterium]